MQDFITTYRTRKKSCPVVKYKLLKILAQWEKLEESHPLTKSFDSDKQEVTLGSKMRKLSCPKEKPEFKVFLKPSTY